MDPEGKLSKDQLGIWEDGQIDGLKEIVDAVHEEDCPIFLQIHHAGVNGSGGSPLVRVIMRWIKTEKNRSRNDERTDTEGAGSFVKAAVRAYQAAMTGWNCTGATVI